MHALASDSISEVVRWIDIPPPQQPNHRPPACRECAARGGRGAPRAGSPLWDRRTRSAIAAVVRSSEQVRQGVKVPRKEAFVLRIEWWLLIVH